MIHFNHVSKKFADIDLLKDINIFLPKASYTFIYGAAESGKTTLLKLIMAYEKPDGGSLTVDEMDISTLPNERIPFLRRKIGLVETTPLMLENRTTRENISVPMQVAGFDKKAMQERVSLIIKQAGLETIADVPVQKLDIDQRRLVSCARASVHRPDILLVDEPEAEMRASTEMTQNNLLQQLHNDNTTIIVTKKETSALTSTNVSLPAGSTALVIDDGKIAPYENTEYNQRS